MSNTELLIKPDASIQIKDTFTQNKNTIIHWAETDAFIQIKRYSFKIMKPLFTFVKMRIQSNKVINELENTFGCILQTFFWSICDVDK